MTVPPLLSLEAEITVVSGIIAYVVLKRYLSRRGSDVWKLKRAVRIARLETTFTIGNIETRSSCPQLGAHWLWGNEKDAWAQPDGSFYTHYSNELGSAFVVNAALFIAITDPVAITHMFSRHAYSYVKSSCTRPVFERVVGHSLFLTEGDEHKRQRQMLAPVFTSENVKKMSDAIYDATDKLVDRLRTRLHDSPPSQPLNIVGWPSKATLDIIGSVGFGYDFKCGESDEAKAIAADWNMMVNMGLTFPGFIAPLVIRAFPFIANLPVKAIQVQGGMKVVIKKLGLEIVDARAGVDGGNGADLLSTLLRLQDSERQELDQLLDHIVTFTVAGNETTGSTLNFALFELARNKTMQDRLRQELVDFRGSGPGGEPTYEEFQTKLLYLDAVCKEVLRMYPAESHMERISLNDDVLPLRFPVKSQTGEELSSIKIKAGQVIYIPVMAINRNSAVWGSNAEQFVPERWLEPSKLPAPDTLSKGVGGMLTFLEGPRICIGYRLALFEFKVILSAFIRNFGFADTGVKIVTQFSATLQPYIEGKKDDGVQIPLIMTDLQQ